MTSTPRLPDGEFNSGGTGFAMDPDQMRECLKIAQRMFDDLNERAEELSDLVGVMPPGHDEASTGYTTGGGRGRSAMAAGSGYQTAYQGQLSWLGQLIPKLQQALARAEADDAAAAASMGAKENELS